MTRIHPAWLAREERYWLRHDAHRWRRPDHARFDKPQRVERKYSPDQPRVPAGHTDGGQWTREGGSSALLAPLNIPSDALSLFEGDGEAAEPAVQLAYLGPAVQAGRVVIQTSIEAALALYTALSVRNVPDSQAVAVFRSADFEPGADPQTPVSAVGRLTRDEVDQVCPAHGLVQNLTDNAAASFDRADYTPSAYGTAVHTMVRDDIRELDNPNLRAEVSFVKTVQETGSRPREARYGQSASIRVDALESAGNYTVCVYDIKTGGRILGPSRMREIAETVSRNFPGTLRLVVTEVRPRR